MRKYNSTIGFAFTSEESDEKAHGNPALIVFGNPSINDKILISKEARVELNNEIIALPIITFVNPVDEDNNIFDIDYYLCDGTHLSICGHGTICAARALSKRYKKENNRQRFTFNLNQEFEENRKFPHINLEICGNDFTSEFDDVDLELVDENTDIYKLISKNIPDIKDGKIFVTDIKDYICVSNNTDAVRDLVIPIEELRRLRTLDPLYRNITVVAKSNIGDYDYETGLFCDGLPPPLYKDPACGSVNKEIPKLLKVTNVFPDRFKTGSSERFRMFYPYRFVETGVKGGIQSVEYRHKIGKIYVSGQVILGDHQEIVIGDNGIDFRTE